MRTSWSVTLPCLETRGGGGGTEAGGGGEGGSFRRGQCRESCVDSDGGGGGGGRQVSVCVCGLPNEKFCMLNLHTVLSARLQRQRHYTWVPMSICSAYSSSTPTVPVSGTELLYGGSGGDGTERDGGEHPQEKHRLKELDLHGNKRPPSRNNANGRKAPNFDKVPFDRDREELRPVGSSLGSSLGTKQSPLRANGIKNNLLRADHFLSHRNSGREDDLVAMGTLWNPGHLQQTRGSSTGTTTTSSGKSTSAPTPGSGGGGGGSSGGGGGGMVPGRRPVNLSTSTSTRQLLHHGGGGGSGSFGPGGAGAANGGVRVAKEVEPKYSDPLSGANPTFQQRLMELAVLEADTVRWERTKKMKKKPKQDRDS